MKNKTLKTGLALLLTLGPLAGCKEERIEKQSRENIVYNDFANDYLVDLNNDGNVDLITDKFPIDSASLPTYAAKGTGFDKYINSGAVLELSRAQAVNQYANKILSQPSDKTLKDQLAIEIALNTLNIESQMKGGKQ